MRSRRLAALDARAAAAAAADAAAAAAAAGIIARGCCDDSENSGADTPVRGLRRAAGGKARKHRLLRAAMRLCDSPS